MLPLVLLGYAVQTLLAGGGGRPIYLRAPRACALRMEDAPFAPPRWFPELDVRGPDEEPSGAEGASVMPLFPLGQAYLPHTEPVLNIFEPRYRQMYNDILMNGARRFCVCNIDGETGRFSEVGVVFYLEELKEVSGQTQDRVKYIGQHKVIDRVSLVSVLNPSAVRTRETYLKAEVRPIVDVDADADTAAEEREVKQAFMELVMAQAELKEEPRYTDAVREKLSFTRGSDPKEQGLWGSIGLWQQFLEQRAMVNMQKMEREIQEQVQAYLKENTLEGLANSRGEIRMEDLPATLLQEIRNTQTRYRDELQAMGADPHGGTFQTILQSDSHAERLRILRGSLDNERKRLEARAQLKKLFAH